MSKEDDFVFRATEEPVKENTAGGAKDILLITGIGDFFGLSLSKVLLQYYLVAGLDKEIEYPILSGHIPCDLTSNWSIKGGHGRIERTLRLGHALTRLL
jgi:hypothetical protein